MAKLGKEATTTRRVLESLFRYFDDDNLWPTENGIAVPILKDMQYTMDASGMKLLFNFTYRKGKIEREVSGRVYFLFILWHSHLLFANSS